MNPSDKAIDALPALSNKLSSVSEGAREDLADYFKAAAVPLAVVKLIHQLEYAAFLLTLPVNEFGNPTNQDAAGAAAGEISTAIVEISRLSVELSKLQDGVQS